LHACNIDGLGSLKEELLRMSVPVVGRELHSVSGATQFQPYGKNDSECNYSISRSELNKFLLDQAEIHGVTIHFGSELKNIVWDGADQVELFMSQQTGADGESELSLKPDAVIGADGAGSKLRGAMQDHGKTSFTKVMCVQADRDGSFTGTFYTDMEGGDHSFEELDSAEKVGAVHRMR
jgi:kynurenine 3-monooxygenase